MPFGALRESIKGDKRLFPLGTNARNKSKLTKTIDN